MTEQSPSARGPLPESPAQPRPTPGPHRTVRPVCRADRRASFPGRGHGQPSADSSGAVVATADEYRAAAEHRLSHRLADRSATRFPGKPPPDPRIGRKRRDRPCGPRPHAFRTSRSIRRRSAAQPDTLCGTGLRKRFSPYLRIVQNERIGAIRCRKNKVQETENPTEENKVRKNHGNDQAARRFPNDTPSCGTTAPRLRRNTDKTRSICNPPLFSRGYSVSEPGGNRRRH